MEDFKEAYGPEVFNAVEFSCFGQWDEPALFPIFRYVLSWPEGAKHLICGLVEVVRKSLEVSIRETRHAWGRVLFVGLDSCEIVVVGGWLSEDFGEA